jgi:transposase
MSLPMAATPAISWPRHWPDTAGGEIEIAKRSDCAGSRVLTRRWLVERTFAWLNCNRRLAKDFEATVASSEVWLYLASVQLLARWLARSAN